MSVSDYYRPSQDQINIVYKCDKCGSEIEQCSVYGVGNCSCGGEYDEIGESYPSNSDDWNEQRDSDGEWRERRY